MKKTDELLNIKVGNDFIRIKEENLKKNKIEVEKLNYKINFGHTVEDLYHFKEYEDSRKFENLKYNGEIEYEIYPMTKKLFINEQTMYEKLKDLIENKENEIAYNRGDTPFTSEEIVRLCEDYVLDYGSVTMTDNISEYADSNVDLYEYDTFKNASKFSEMTDKAIEEFGMPKDADFHKILQMGQYQAYSEVLYENIEQMGLHCSYENAKEWLEENKKMLNTLENYLSKEEKEKMIDYFENSVEDLAKKYSNDELNMKEIDYNTLNETLPFEKTQALEAVLAGANIEDFPLFSHKTNDIINSLEELQKDFSNQSDLIDEDFLLDCCSEISSYSNVGLSEAIYEVADSKTPVYYDDIYKEAKFYNDEIMEVIEEGIPKGLRLIDIMQQGIGRGYEQGLYENINNIGLYKAYDEIIDYVKENKEDIEKICFNLKNADKDFDIKNIVEDLKTQAEKISSLYVNEELELGKKPKEISNYFENLKNSLEKEKSNNLWNEKAKTDKDIGLGR